MTALPVLVIATREGSASPEVTQARDPQAAQAAFRAKCDSGDYRRVALACIHQQWRRPE